MVASYRSNRSLVGPASQRSWQPPILTNLPNDESNLNCGTLPVPSPDRPCCCYKPLLSMTGTGIHLPMSDLGLIYSVSYHFVHSILLLHTSRCRISGALPAAWMRCDSTMYARAVLGGRYLTAGSTCSTTQSSAQRTNPPPYTAPPPVPLRSPAHSRHPRAEAWSRLPCGSATLSRWRYQTTA